MKSDEDIKVCAFDIEIAIIPEDWEAERPFGLICGGTQLTGEEVKFWYNPHGGSMTRRECGDMLLYMRDKLEEGYIPVGWNSLKFDFDILGEEAQMRNLAASLAIQSYDPMFQFLCVKGFPVSLDAVSSGMGFAGKTKEVTLNSGEVIKDMSGASAPDMWARGELNAVLDYLHGDVVQTMQVAQEIDARQGVEWITKAGRRSYAMTGSLMSIKECLAIPVPDTAWMDAPIPRNDFFGWTSEVGIKF